ncbi:MAG: ATP-binding cassette domain-containing protein [Actinobacteria bacterium]|nr:ATP-binding cassette domain-containing protein [Actinomycetota bacterium]
MTPALVMTDVAVRAGRRLLWSGLTAQLQPGEFTAVLGPNGAGKSTLIKAVLGLHPLAAGRLTVLGGAPGESNREIGYLPQRRSVDPTLRVRGIDIVRLGLDGHRYGLPLPGRGARRAAAEVDALVELVGATGWAHRPVGELSGGEQQRLLIAQALARRPRLLLLDEPLDALDLANQAAIAGLIGRICTDRQVSVVMVAHDVNPILPYLDRVLYLANGRVATGPPGAVITSETLTALLGAPIEVLSTADGRLVVVGQPEAPHLHSARHRDEAPQPGGGGRA